MAAFNSNIPLICDTPLFTSQILRLQSCVTMSHSSGAIHGTHAFVYAKQLSTNWAILPYQSVFTFALFYFGDRDSHSTGYTQTPDPPASIFQEMVFQCIQPWLVRSFYLIQNEDCGKKGQKCCHWIIINCFNCHKIKGERKKQTWRIKTITGIWKILVN